MTKSRKQSPNILTASRILRELDKHTIEARRTILHFVHQSVEETFQEEQRVTLTELGEKASAANREAMTALGCQFSYTGLLENGQALG